MKYLIPAILLTLLYSCTSEEEISFGLAPDADCKRAFGYLQQLGFNPSTSALTTTDKKLDGVVLVDVQDPTHKYQHPSWQGKGKMGPIAIDEQGNAYVAPVPFVNVLDAVRKNQNLIYKINAATAEMTTLCTIGEQRLNSENAYGVVGLFYHCGNKLLYASSLAGSSKDQELGCIYAIDVSTGSIKYTLKNTDAMGIGIAHFNEKPHLFYGSTRNGNMYRIQLSEEGDFVGSPKECFNLSAISPRGDDIVKKIRFTAKGNMLITGTPFYYNLTAPTQVPESKYEYSFDLNTGKWKGVLLAE